MIFPFEESKQIEGFPIIPTFKVLSKLTVSCIKFLANWKIKTAQKERRHSLDTFRRITEKKELCVSHGNPIVLS